MLQKQPILIILKPEIFGPTLRLDQGEVFLPGVEFPSPEVFLGELFEGIIDEYDGPYSFRWAPDQIRAQYSEPHHFVTDPGFSKNRVDTFVDMYTGRLAQIAIAHGEADAPELLSLRKKELRKKYLRNPGVPFYNLYHVSDSFADARREIAIYEKYVQ